MARCVRNGQNSVALLTSRLGKRNAEGSDASPEVPTTTAEPEVGGCAASGSESPLAGVAVVLLALRRRRVTQGPMLTGKQRRYLRGLGHELKVVVQVGKGGIDDGVIAAVDQALTDHELIKLKVGDNANLDRHDAATRPRDTHEQ